MQLTRLRMQNFGPYRDETVDFTPFQDLRVFLISGQTGSGKTTIFDAMVYALYGTTAGGERTGEEMRSKFAEPAAPTVVTLTFAQGGKTYVIERQPTQWLAKQRGAGLTKKGASVEMTVFDGTEEVAQYKQKKAVAPRIQELLHLDADQFRQMILLPQGQFRQFLDADSDAKADLLRQLFGTGLYAHWQEAMKTQATAVAKTMAAQEDRLQVLLTQFDYGSTPAPAETTPVADQLTAMTAVVDDQTSAVAAAQAAKQTASAALTAANQALQTAQQLAQAFGDEAKAQGVLAQLGSQQDAIKDKQQVISELQWVQTHEQTAQQLATQRERVTSLQATSAAAETALTQAETALKEATVRQTTLQAEAASNHQRQQQLHDLGQVETVLAAIATLSDQQAKQQQAFQQAQAALTNRQTEATHLSQRLAENQQAQQALATNDQSASLQQLQTLLAKADPVAAQLEQAQTRVTTQTAQLDRLTQAVTVAKTVQAHASQTYTALHDAQLTDRIAGLVAQLSPGQPCPVCGSTDHPHPHVVTATKAVSDDELAAAEQERQAADQTVATATADQAAAAKRLGELQQEVKQLTSTLSELVGDEPVAKVADLTAQAKALQQTIEMATTEAANLKQAETALIATQTQQQTAIEQANEAVHTAQLALKATSATLTARQAELPPNAPTLVAVQTQKRALQEKVDAYQQASTQAQTQLTTAQTARATATANLANHQQQLTETQQALATAEQQFSEALTDFFGTDAETKFTARFASLGQLTTLQQEVQAFQTQLTQQHALLTQAQTVIAGQSRPDLPAVTAAASAAQQAVETATDHVATLTGAATRNAQVLTQAETAYQANQDQLAESNALQNLSAVMNGFNSQKLSLERYVLRAYLAKVLGTANSELSQLTNGRYAFHLHDEHGGSKNKTGLEIDVYDDQVGEMRSVHTLSGGESFIAALSLALGLGEVIQEESGGISIDALFVDEGFGSLDTASLHTALEALETLEGQSRMIGIISHVTELREGIPDQLQVTPTGAGDSHVKVVHLNE